MSYKDPNKDKAYRQAYGRAYRQAHKEEAKAYRQAHKEEAKAYTQAHKDDLLAYCNSDLNSFGQTKNSIRLKSRRYLNKYGTKIVGYEIHHCCTYTEPYKFIYCSRELHKLIHIYLRQHNINADSDHYEQIKHLLDEHVVKYGIE